MFAPPIARNLPTSSSRASIRTSTPRFGARYPPAQRRVTSASNASWDFEHIAVWPTLPAVNATTAPLAIGRSSDELERAGTGHASTAVFDALRTGGQPLAESTRTFFGGRFGVDFSNVRVHTNAAAARSAAAVDATAYTVGTHIVLGPGAPSPETTAGRQLFEHELTHVVQQAHGRPLLQRQPNKPTTPTPFVTADLVTDIKRDNETWTLTVDGFTSVASFTRALFPHVVPDGVTVTMDVALTEPIERGVFVITGLSPARLMVAEPSFKKLFEDHGLQEEQPESDEMQKARIAFLKRQSDYSSQQLLNLLKGLDLATKRNPELRLAYFKYYSEHALDDESVKDYNPRKDAGRTNYGETIINPAVVNLASTFPTSDPLSLLGSTMIHEFVHTAHGGQENSIGAAVKEAKAYGIEMFFAERMGDEKRRDHISNMDWGSSLDINTGANQLLWKTYSVIKALYAVIDQGGAAAIEARGLALEFISKNSDSYSRKLKEFIARH